MLSAFRPGCAALLAALAICAPAAAGPLPVFTSDESADTWLRANSPLYRRMAKEADAQGGYHFKATADYPKGVVIWDDGRRYIALNEGLRGAERVSVIIFELTNCYHEAKHAAVDEGARTGEIASPGEFALWHEVIEQDGLKLHRDVLVELDPVVDGLPKEVFSWIAPGVANLADYRLAPIHDSLRSQQASGHFAFYKKWYWKQLGKEEPPGEAAKHPAPAKSAPKFPTPPADAPPLKP